jgi:hypothetical protein
MTDLIRRRRALAPGARKVTFAGCMLEEAAVHGTIVVHSRAGESRGQ